MKRTLLLLALLVAAHAVNAQVDTIRVGQPFKNFKLLEPTNRQYLRYLLTNGKRLPVDLWTRSVTFEQVNGKQLLH
ncbi:MAG: hypothetical protein EOO89_27125, partial [Pedobacter sp.]